MEHKSRKRFIELGKTKIRQNRNIVVSKDSDGYITIAQQIEIVEDGRPTNIFMKGAIEVEAKYFSGLVELLEEIEKEIL